MYFFLRWGKEQMKIYCRKISVTDSILENILSLMQLQRAIKPYGCHGNMLLLLRLPRRRPSVQMVHLLFLSMRTCSTSELRLQFNIFSIQISGTVKTYSDAVNVFLNEGEIILWKEHKSPSHQN